jgi:rare lipoprotein A
VLQDVPEEIQARAARLASLTRGAFASCSHESASSCAAHRTLPFGTQVTVVNRGNGRAVMVRINDRGPFVHGRVIDLSPAAGRALDIDGLASVSLVVGDADASHANKHSSEPVAQEEGLNGP